MKVRGKETRNSIQSIVCHLHRSIHIASVCVCVCVCTDSVICREAWESIHSIQREREETLDFQVYYLLLYCLYSILEFFFLYPINLVCVYIKDEINALSRLLSPGQRQPKCKKKRGGGLGKTRETRWKVYTHTKQNKRAVDNLFMSVCTFDSFSLFKCFIMPLSTIPLFRTIMVINRIGHMSSLYRAGPSYIVCREFFSSRSKKKKKKKRNSVLPISWLLPGGVGARKKKKKEIFFI